MSIALVEKNQPPQNPFLERNQVPSAVDQCFAAFPERLRDIVEVISRIAPDLLNEVRSAVGTLKLKLLLPVKTIETGHLWWFQSFVLIEDLQKFGLDTDRFVQQKLQEGMAVSVQTLKEHHIEVSNSVLKADWLPRSKTIRLSAAVLKQGCQYLLFELRNAASNRDILGLSEFPKDRRVVELEKIEFRSKESTRNLLERLGYRNNIFQLTHRHFDLHLLHQDVKGHVDISKAFLRVRASLPYEWPCSMDREERKQLGFLIDAHIYCLHGNEVQQAQGKTVMDRYRGKLSENVRNNWDWYLNQSKNFEVER